MGAVMHAERRGAGRPLVLVHGLGSSARTWDPVIAPLAAAREVIAVNLPGFGHTPPLDGPVTVAALTDAVEEFTRQEGLADASLVGSSMGARMVLEMARRGHRGNVVALDPGGFWNDAQAAVFGLTVKASIALVRSIQPALPALARSRAGRTALLAQFSAAPWKLPPELVLAELRGFRASPSIYQALDALARGPRQAGAPAGSLPARTVIGWGRQDRVTVPSQARRAALAFPDACLHWFERCGHFPHWDQPEQAVAVILAATGEP